MPETNSTNPPASPDVRTLRLPRSGDIPNNPALPVVLMKGAVAPDAGPAATRTLLEENGWGGTWEYTVFDFHHYHPNAHEALVVARGWADLTLGGPGAETLRVEAGDAVVLPAGTGHCRVDAAPDFLVCGAYPPGQEDYDTLRAGDPWPDDLPDRIAHVARPATDPVHGDAGPLMQAWAR